jgi:hypothetical protein
LNSELFLFGVERESIPAAFGGGGGGGGGGALRETENNNVQSLFISIVNFSLYFSFYKCVRGRNGVSTRRRSRIHTTLTFTLQQRITQILDN